MEFSKKTIAKNTDISKNINISPIKLTLPGVISLFVAVLLLLISLIGQNLILLFIALVLVFMFVFSLLITSRGLSNLQPIRKVPQIITRFKPYLFKLGIKNKSRILSIYSVKIRDVLDNQVIDKPCYFFKIKTSRTQSTYYRHAFIKRGEIVFNGVIVTTTFPFLLIKRSRFIPLVSEAVIYPEIISTNIINKSTSHYQVESTFNLKNYRPGDHPKLINWPASLRKQRLLTKFEDRQQIKPIWLKIENRLIPHPEGGYIRSSDIFEYTISKVAGTAWELLNSGREVGIITRGSILEPIAGKDNFPTILRFLALIGFNEREFPFIPIDEIIQFTNNLTT
ncbi:MAG: DUF58 domain-containing protein [Deltaproteobacteria bacterium]|jgi:uncharacterized protein (DUF58 family)|nr:DUF58 domain-containing protein [Deltaproteobacteria bacterium]